MLQIDNISKEYKTGSLVQRALDHVSVALRDNEFVAILGPSGSGKTTLLNIIGGLDRYDSGDIIINGISTKLYKDRDWDSYRNHTIGFVFQSYNLIPHQSVLSNVELALTISGISKRERRQRAITALDSVGLGEHIHKKPSQLSGGQMQRVAIARALVNNPDILLADEPTGALDTETSIQVMELLKQVANDRLVVMVTHNPDLATQYATRIVQLKDGVIQSDSNPLDVHLDNSAYKHKNLGKSSMSFLTALNLSFNNLRTKLARTVLVSLAGSIGIIGIALILSLSNGVNAYIRSIEESTLSEYPVQITSSSFDLTSAYMMANSSESQSEENVAERSPDKVYEIPIVNSMLSRSTSNDLQSLRLFLDNNLDIPHYVNAIEYSFNYEPYIYSYSGNTHRQVNPDSSFSALGFGGVNSGNSLLSMFSSTNQFYPLPTTSSLYLDQYEIVAGHWPHNKNEAVLVLMNRSRITDFLLYTLGFKDANELESLVKSFTEGENVSSKPSELEFDYEDFLDIDYKVLSPHLLFLYDEEFDVWVDKTTDDLFVSTLLNNADTLSIKGVAVLKEDSDVAMLQSGIYYYPDLIPDLVYDSSHSDIVKQQKSDPLTNVFTGNRFDEENSTAIDFSNIFSVDENALAKAFYFDANKISFDTSSLQELQNINIDMLLSPEDFNDLSISIDFSSLQEDIDIQIDYQNIAPAFQELMNSFLLYASEDPTTDYSRLSSSIQEYLLDPETQEKLNQELSSIIENNANDSISTELIIDALTHVLDSYTQYADASSFTTPEDYVNGLQEYLSSSEGEQALTESASIIRNAITSSEIPAESVESIISLLVSDYSEYAETHSMPDPTKINATLESYISSDKGSEDIKQAISSFVDIESLQAQLNTWINKQIPSVQQSLQPLMNTVMNRFTQVISKTMESSLSNVVSSFGDAFHIDPNMLTNAFRFNIKEEDFTSLMLSMMQQQQNTYEENLRKLGYVDLNKPSVISIYPKDFDSKEVVINILNSYNDEMKVINPDKVITFTDTVGTLMSSVTTIVDTVSYVLVAFVAISLIVSSIMIGVITYISVLERRKEIGILRAIGASKNNISQVFNAETFIIGALAGILGIILTHIILVPGNILIHHLTNNYEVNAFLPPIAAIILIVLSTLLTLIGGIIPSKKAANSDPVAALRSE